MKTSEEIRTEPDPFLREVWAMGYDFVYEDICSDTILLCRKSDEYKKQIPRYDYYDFTISKSILPDWNIHVWISGSDGSSDRFRDLIRPEKVLDFKVNGKEKRNERD